MDTLPEDSNLPDEPDLPYEYVNSKIPWKKILIGFSIVLIASVPFVVSLFHISYVSQKSTELMETAYLQSQHSGVWGGLVTGVRYLIKAQPTATPTPVTSAPFIPSSAHDSGSEPVQIHYQVPSPSQEYNNQAYPTDVPQQGGYSTPNGEYYFTYPTQTQEEYVYPTQPYEYPTQTQEYYPYPTQPNQEQQTQYQWHPSPTLTLTPTPILVGCEGKKNNSECTYLSQYGHVTKGVCKMYYGYFTCVPKQ